jgi:hypothetical protein
VPTISFNELTPLTSLREAPNGLQVGREKEQQCEGDSRKREKNNQHKTRHAILPVNRIFSLHAKQRASEQKSRVQKLGTVPDDVLLRSKIATKNPVQGHLFASIEQ